VTCALISLRSSKPGRGGKKPSNTKDYEPRERLFGSIEKENPVVDRYMKEQRKYSSREFSLCWCCEKWKKCVATTLFPFTTVALGGGGKGCGSLFGTLGEAVQNAE